MDNQKFKRILDRKAIDNCSSIIPNSSLENGATAMIKMFDFSKRNIKLFVGSFESQIPNTPGYKEALGKAIKDQKVKVEVLLTKRPSPDTAILSFLIDLMNNNYSDQISLKIISEDAEKKLAEEIDNRGKPFYFAVVDDGYRFEKDIVNHTAWVCFNDKEKSERLADVFDQVYSLSNPI